MPDREKVIKGLEVCVDRVPGKYDCNKCPYEIDGNYCEINLAKDTLTLLKEQEAKPPVHIHEEYPEHDWKRKENGDIDDFAFKVDYHTGPVCKRCNYSFCIYCDPDGWKKEPCIIDKNKCPKCGRYIIKGTKFCSDCGQALKWE